jgi:hypothetical protein
VLGNSICSVFGKFLVMRGCGKGREEESRRDEMRNRREGEVVVVRDRGGSVGLGEAAGESRTSRLANERC